jgi:phosphopantothenoylcysteine decarboxylase
MQSPFRLPDHKRTVDGSGLPKWPDRPLHVILATTGSVASIKAPLIVAELLKVQRARHSVPLLIAAQYKNIRVQVVATKSSLAFFTKAEVEAYEGVQVFQDEDEWTVRGRSEVTVAERCSRAGMIAATRYCTSR